MLTRILLPSANVSEYDGIDYEDFADYLDIERAKYKKGGMDRIHQASSMLFRSGDNQPNGAVAYAEPINIPRARATVSQAVAEPMPNSSWVDVAEPPVARPINLRLEATYKRIDLHGMPSGEPDITMLLHQNPDFNLSYADSNGMTLLDRAIQLSSMKVFTPLKI